MGTCRGLWHLVFIFKISLFKLKFEFVFYISFIPKLVISTILAFVGMKTILCLASSYVAFKNWLHAQFSTLNSGHFYSNCGSSIVNNKCLVSVWIVSCSTLKNGSCIRFVCFGVLFLTLFNAFFFFFFLFYLSEIYIFKPGSGWNNWNSWLWLWVIRRGCNV